MVVFGHVSKLTKLTTQKKAEQFFDHAEDSRQVLVTTTTFNTGEKAVNVASFAFSLTACLCIALSMSFYLANDEKFHFKSIAVALIIFALSFSFISSRGDKDSDPIHYWASTLQKVLICLYLTMSLLPIFFITSLPGTAYWVMTLTSLASGLISFAFGKYYFDPKILNQKMAKEGILKEG